MKKFSIIIPAYKNAIFLERLLTSISVQTFKDFEVVITDDSPNKDLVPIIQKFDSSFKIIYKYNTINLGSPGNWNEGLKLASGEWIKIMHNDDWFADGNSLSEFNLHIEKNSKSKFFYCGCMDVYFEKNTVIKKSRNVFEVLLLNLSVFNVLYSQPIGNPSCTIFKKDNSLDFDKNFIWLVDVDFYINYILKHKKIKYIPKHLINVGISKEQITNNCIDNPEIQVRESYLLLEKYKIKKIKNLIIFDYLWRMYRNLNIKSIQVLEQYLGHKNQYPQLNNIIVVQNRFSENLRSNRIISKLLMIYTYFKGNLNY